MQTTPYFSIVMPVYNVEKYLPQAVQCVREQTFVDFECILVDDASPDGCAALCDQYAGEDKRFRVIHLPQNGGISNARNQGFTHVRGEYVWFVDSDDFFDKTLLQTVYDALQQLRAKLVVFGVVEEYYGASGSKGYSRTITMPEHFCRTREEVRQQVIHLEEKTLYGYAWNKVYEVEYLRGLDLSYTSVALIEDIAFNIGYCMDVDSMILLEEAPYHYNRRIEASLTSKFVTDYFRLHRTRVSMIYHQYKKWDMLTDEVKTILAGIYMRYILSTLERNCHKKSEMNHRKRVAWMKRLYEDPLYNSLAPYFNPDTTAMRLMGGQIAAHRIGVSLIAGRAIYLVKDRMPICFARFKQRR